MAVDPLIELRAANQVRQGGDTEMNRDTLVVTTAIRSRAADTAPAETGALLQGVQ